MNIFGSILDLLFPPRCLVCASLSDDVYCASCMKDTRPISVLCDVCGRPMRSGGVCDDCGRRRPPFRLARAVALYDGRLKTAIHKLKFRGKKALSAPLSRMMADHLAGDGWKDILASVDIVTAVPLHRMRLRERGFNQSEMLGRAVAARFNLVFRDDVLEKTRDTKRQFGLMREERFSNVKGAFAVRRAADLRGRRVLLIDDILTTGATAAECSGKIIEAGAAEVFVAALSHAVDLAN